MNIAALLGALILLSPVPRQSPNQGSSGSQKPPAKAHTSKPPTSASPTVVQKDCTSEKFKNAPECKPSGDKENAVVISKLPTANITIQRNPERDGWDWLAYFSGVALSIAGIAGVSFAYFTLRAIQRQAVVMGEQREVMAGQLRIMHEQITVMSEQTQHLERSVLIVISKERARIALKVEKLTLREGLQWVEYDIHYSGLTTASILETSAIAAVSDSADAPPGPGFPTPMQIPAQINPGIEPLRRKAFMFPDLTLNESQMEDVYAGRKFIHLWGFIRYKDAFFDVFPVVRETTFRLIWRFPDKPAKPSLESPGKEYGFWITYGPTEANRET